MSSIRPLATITVLAAAGIFLYLKINQTEPQIPADVADFEFDEGLEFGSPVEAVPEFTADAGAFDPAADTAPAFTATPAAGQAPAFAATTPSAGVAEQAPAFTPGVADPPTVSETTAPAEVAAVAPAFVPNPQTTAAEETTPAVPDLPPEVTDPLAAQSVEPTTAQNAGGEAPAFQSVPVATEPVPQETTSQPPVVATTPTEEFSTTPDMSITPTPTTTAETVPNATTPPVEQASLFAATRSAVEAALDRGQLSQALLLLSDWYGDPSLTPQESQEVEQLLSQLAGSVIYSQEHRLEPPYMVQAGETLETIAAKYQVPWQLLAKINGVTSPDQLQAGQQLKVIRGPFSATVDLRKREVTLMLNRRYAGKFSIEVDPTTSVEEGHWAVNQKMLTPGNVSQFATPPDSSSEQHSLILSNPTGENNQLVIIRGNTTNAGGVADPTGRVIRLSARDVSDVYDILSLGSEVTIRR